MWVFEMKTVAVAVPVVVVPVVVVSVVVVFAVVVVVIVHRSASIPTAPHWSSSIPIDPDAADIDVR